MTTQRTTFTARDNELVMSRSFRAPRDLVFRAWTDCDALRQWWGPRSWPMSFCEMDLRPGGVWRYAMREEGTGQESWGKGVYREIAPPERLVYTDYFSDPEGTKTSPPTEITLTFEQRGDETVINGVSVFSSKEQLEEVLKMGMEEGHERDAGPAGGVPGQVSGRSAGDGAGGEV